MITLIPASLFAIFFAGFLLNFESSEEPERVAKLTKRPVIYTMV